MNIYNLKKEMKNIIYSDSSLSKNSIRDRNSALNKIFENFNNLDDVSVITKDKILDNLNSIKFKTKLSAGVNAIRFLKEHNLDVDFPSEDELKEIIKNKKKNNRKPTAEKNLIDIERKVNRVRKKNYRLAYKLMLESGLRVHEVAALKKDDFSFDKNLINSLPKFSKNYYSLLSYRGKISNPVNKIFKKSKIGKITFLAE